MEFNEKLKEKKAEKDMTSAAMDTNVYTIRLERTEDYREVENLVRESFWNVYRPGCSEHFVIHELRDDPAFKQEERRYPQAVSQGLTPSPFHKSNSCHV